MAKRGGTIISDSLTHWLKEHRLWTRFTSERNRLAKLAQTSKTKQNEAALKMVVPDMREVERLPRTCREEEGMLERASPVFHPETGDMVKTISVPVPVLAEGEFTKEESGDLTRYDMREAVAWVFNALEVSGVTPQDAPSPGAWGLFREAKRPGGRAKFYETYVPRLLPTKAQLDKEAALEDDGGDLSDEIERFLRGLSEGGRAGRRDAISEEDGVPEDVPVPDEPAG